MDGRREGVRIQASPAPPPASRCSLALTPTLGLVSFRYLDGLPSATEGRTAHGRQWG